METARWSRSRYIAMALVATMALEGCSGAKKGAAIGGAVGAATGAIIGNQSGHSGTGAATGAVVGAAAGAIIGDYMAKQKKDLDRVPGAQVVQEGNELRVKFESAILFDIDSSTLKLEAQNNLREMAKVLVKYPDTDLVVSGHTDNTGTEAHNQGLSERRAQSVKEFLTDNGVGRGRLDARGYGETRPVASNASDSGRSQNRRVEVQIAANQDLRQKAETQAQTQGH